MQRRCAVHGQWVITLTHQILPVILALYCLQVRNESYKEFNIWLYFGEFSRLKSQWAADVRAATWQKLYWSSQLLCDLFSLHCTITLNLRAPPDAKSHFDPRWQHACTATEPSDHLTGSIRVTYFSFHCLTSVYLIVTVLQALSIPDSSYSTRAAADVLRKSPNNNSMTVCRTYTEIYSV